MQYSLLRIAEHKLSKFQVSEADSVLMTVINDGCNLVEKRDGFWLGKSLLAPYVGVQVSMRWREEYIGMFWSDKDTFNTVDSWISFHSKVAREDRMRWVCGNNLKRIKKQKQGRGENNRSVTSGHFKIYNNHPYLAYVVSEGMFVYTVKEGGCLHRFKDYISSCKLDEVLMLTSNEGLRRNGNSSWYGGGGWR